jgi:hypothetical protein
MSVVRSISIIFMRARRLEGYDHSKSYDDQREAEANRPPFSFTQPFPASEYLEEVRPLRKTPPKRVSLPCVG